MIAFGSRASRLLGRISPDAFLLVWALLLVGSLVLWSHRAVKFPGSLLRLSLLDRVIYQMERSRDQARVILAVASILLAISCLAYNSLIAEGLCKSVHHRLLGVVLLRLALEAWFVLRSLLLLVYCGFPTEKCLLLTPEGQCLR